VIKERVISGENGLQNLKQLADEDIVVLPVQVREELNRFWLDYNEAGWGFRAFTDGRGFFVVVPKADNWYQESGDLQVNSFEFTEEP